MKIYNFTGTSAMYVPRLKNRENTDNDKNRINFEEIDDDFINEILHYNFENIGFFHKLFSTQYERKSNLPSVFIGTRKVKKTRKKYTDKKPKSFKFISVELHYFISIMYEIILDFDKDLFYETSYDANQKIIYENVNKLLRIFNSRTNFFLKNNNGYTSEAIYKINENVYHIEQISFNNEEIDNKIQYKYNFTSDVYFSKLFISDAEMLFYRDQVKNYKGGKYFINRLDWFLDIGVEKDKKARAFQEHLRNIKA